MTSRNRPTHTLDHSASERRGAQVVDAEASRRKQLIEEMGLEVGDHVRLNLKEDDETDDEAQAKEPFHRAICRIERIDKRYSLILFNRRFKTRRDSRETRTYDPSKVQLHEKRAKPKE